MLGLLTCDHATSWRSPAGLDARYESAICAVLDIARRLCIMMQDMSTTPNRTHAQQLVSLRTGREVPDLLRDLYLSRGLSQEDIARELGITRNTVAMWLREHGISRADRQAIA